MSKETLTTTIVDSGEPDRHLHHELPEEISFEDQQKRAFRDNTPDGLNSLGGGNSGLEEKGVIFSAEEGPTHPHHETPAAAPIEPQGEVVYFSSQKSRKNGKKGTKDPHRKLRGYTTGEPQSIDITGYNRRSERNRKRIRGKRFRAVVISKNQRGEILSNETRAAIRRDKKNKKKRPRYDGSRLPGL